MSKLTFRFMESREADKQTSGQFMCVQIFPRVVISVKGCNPFGYIQCISSCLRCSGATVQIYELFYNFKNCFDYVFLSGIEAMFPDID